MTQVILAQDIFQRLLEFNMKSLQSKGQQNLIKQRFVLLMREGSGNTDLYYLLYDSK